MTRYLLFLTSWSLTFILSSISAKAATRPRLIDPHATEETKALYHNLGKLARKHILFGHQHATEYGHGWVQGSGHGRVSVRFETATTGPGRMMTFRDDDAELSPADPVDSLR